MFKWLKDKLGIRDLEDVSAFLGKRIATLEYELECTQLEVKAISSLVQLGVKELGGL